MMISLLDWLFIGMLSLAILCLLCSSIFFVRLIRIKQKIVQVQTIMEKKKKDKKKRKRFKRKVISLKKKKKKRVQLSILFLFLGILFISSALFSRHYQATNLGKLDSEGIAEGYYLLNTVTEQLSSIKEQQNSEKKQKNIRELAAKLSGFGVRYADPRLTVEGQRHLNRYYAQMKELGLNLNNQSVESLQQEEIFEGYQKDIKNIVQIQDNVLRYFKVKESTLTRKNK
ncbi:hypothetical protein [Enterococcus termitis]|uniref:hypothetical protein n=1 Tax=Enterococcus termitis TaxID=332950 RepID=UPI000A518141|nr:hypothetical protein [Enterococcus termitis]